MTRSAAELEAPAPHPVEGTPGTSRDDLRPPAARHQALVEWNDTASPLPEAGLFALFAERATARPDAVAVVGEEGALSYGELERRASGIAHRLIGLGVRPEDRVVLAAERSLETVAAILGILRAGAAYVPVDPTHPRERLERLLADVAPAALVGARAALAALAGSPDVPRLALDRPDAAGRRETGAPGEPAADLGPDALAYVLHTSGSTGVPKGVEVPQRAVVRLVRANDFMAFGPDQVFLQLAPLSFDAATLELWGPLLNGGRLVLFPRQLFTLARLDEVVARHGVTALWLTAGLFHLAVDEGIAGLAGLRQLLAGGDVLLPGHVAQARAALPGVALINGYGPTENTTFSTTFPVPDTLGPGPVPIGRPIGNSRAYVLDERLEPTAVGEEGELYVGGAGLARGYLHRPDLTAELFVPDPLAPGRLYRTGDRAAVRPDGTLEFRGRRDFQVKVRGFRVEPAEIEETLRRHPGVRAAVVTAGEAGDTGGDRRLVAYVVAAAGGVAGDELRRFLGERLPGYMVPSAFVALPELPLTASGKVDRRALPAPRWEGPAESERAAPGSPLEARLATLWGEVLGTAEPGLDDDFFDLGGHSLLAARLLARVRQEHGVELGLPDLFAAPTVAGLARQLAAALGAAAGPALPPLEPVARDRPLPLSFAQQRLWFLDRLAPGSPAYNLPFAYRWHGAAAPALAAAFGEIVRRHEALRTRFVERGGEPVQEILPPAAVALPEIDLGRLPKERRQAELAARAADLAARPFDLEAGALLRVALVHLDGGEPVLLVNVHHAVFDGWSEGVLLAELAALSAAAADGRPRPLAALPVQYADFAAWQRAWPPAALARQLAYWREALAGAPTALELPLDRPRPPVQSFRGASVELHLPAERAARLGQAARREGATLYMLLLAGFAALLSRYGAGDDLLVGSPVANRTRPEIEGLIGFFVNTLALRARMVGAPDFRRHLAAVRATVLAAFAHQDLPFETLVAELKPTRDLARNPLVQAVLALQSAGGMAAGAAELPVTRLPLPFRTAKFDLALAVEEAADGGLALTLEYAADLFHSTTAARLLAHYAALLDGAAAAPERPLLDLPLLSVAERHQALAEWNDTAAATAGGWAHELVARQAQRAPAALAVADGDRWLDYGELWTRAAALAGELRVLGVGPEVRVGVCLERSADLVVAALAVLAAGGAYVALDPELPEERLAFQLEDAAAAVLLARRGPLAERAAARGIPCRFPGEWAEAPAAELARPALTADNLAYVIYTSGSTGRPKGVEVSHGALANLIGWHARAFAVTAADRAPLLAGVGFDASVWEIWPYLAHGASLHVVPAAARTAPAELCAWLEEREITLGYLPVALAEAVLERPEQLAGTALRGLLTGGDRLRRRPEAGLPIALWNDYGPTEAAVVTTWGRVAAAGEATGEPTLGRPIDNARVHVLGPAAELLPRGAAGELAIGGAGLARGYAALPEATAERFVPDPFASLPGSRLYRTGDRARQRPSGELEFLGRLDQQVKIRGHRIELGEIEAALTQHPAVSEAAVLALEGRLVAFWTPRAPRANDAPEARRSAGGPKRRQERPISAPPSGDSEGLPPEAASLRPTDGAPDAAAWREFLGRQLPNSMVPATYVPLTTLPVNASGKVDRRALALLVPEREEAASGAPRTPVEEILAGLWEEVLGHAPIGRDDDFFDLGGHSLAIPRLLARLRETLGVGLPVRSLFDHPTVAALAAAIATARRSGAEIALPPLRPRGAGHGRAPLSPAQRRLWFHERLAPAGPLYNIPVAFDLAGPLDPAALAASLAEIGRRQEVLRGRIVEVEGEPWQEVLPISATLPLIDLSGLAGGEAERARLATAEANRPFDLTRGPLWRAHLVRLGGADHTLLLTVHHLAADGGSLALLVAELGALYAAGVARRPSPLAEPAVQYADFAAWQHAWPAAALAAELAWWQAELAGVPTVLELPGDRPRPAEQSFRGAACRLALMAAEAASLRRAARREGMTLPLWLLAGFAALLARHGGQDDLLVGLAVAHRARPELEGLIGLFVNTLPLRARLAGDPPFRALLAGVREAALAGFAHQDLPLDTLVEALKPERDLARNPLVQVLFAPQGPARPTVSAGGLTFSPRPMAARTTAKFDLTLAVEEGDGEGGAGLAFELEYATDLYDATTAVRLLGHYRTLLSAVLSAPELSLSRLPLHTAAERHQALAEWNDTAAVLPELPVHGLFAEQARLRPDTVAVAWEGGQLSYGEIERRAARAARQLRRLGVGREDRVAIFGERCGEMVIALVAILQAGGAYVPLDPGAPRQRLALLVADAAPRVVVGPLHLLARLPEGVPRLAFEHLALDDEDPAVALPAVLPEELVYVIYTSGSTGRPKGVEVTHRGVVRLVRETAWAEFGAGEVVLQMVPLSFDVSTFELWGALLHGGRLALYPPRPFALAELEDVVTRHEVTTAWLTAGLFHLVVEEGGLAALGRLRQLVVGGDAVLRSHAERALAALPEVELIDGYGPTENTTFSTAQKLRGALGEGPVPIGRPIGSSRAYVLGPALELLPVGAVGELCAGGVGVARGYLGRPDLTAERFVPDPFGPPEASAAGERLYRTGDLVRWLADGRIEYLGRRDNQVKVRGIRIELGEIESCLLAHPAVREAAVVARSEGGRDRRLVAYYAAAAPVGAAELRAALRDQLPEALVPSAFVALPSLPLTASGKVDRRALPQSPLGASTGEPSGRPAAAPRTALEELVLGVWQESLAPDGMGEGGLGIHDNFFDAGGHSLLAARVLSRLAQACGVPLSLRDLFAEPTVAGLARRIEAALLGDAAAPAPPIARAARGSGPLPLSPAQERLWFLDRLHPESPLYNIPAAFALSGPLQPAALAGALAEIVRRHEGLRSRVVEVAGEPRQEVLPPESFRLPSIDLGGLAGSPGQRAECARLAAEEAARPFDLAQAPLRAALVRLAAAEHALLLTVHHIASDGASAGVLVQELAALYPAAAAGRPSPLPELQLQVADVAAWQRADRGRVLAAQLAGWKERLAGAPAVLELPTDRPRPPVQSFRGASRTLRLPAAEAARLRRAAREEGATLYMLLWAGLAALLSRYGGQDDLLLGVPVANRPRPELQGLIGLFVNTLAVRARLAGEPDFRRQLAAAREALLAALAHQDLPFEALVEEMKPARDLSRNPLVQVALTLESPALRWGRTLDLGGVGLTRLPAVAQRTAKFDLALSAEEIDEVGGAGLALEVEYATDLFTAETLDRLLRHYAGLLLAAAADPGLPLSRLPLLTPAERHQALVEWNDTRTPYPRESTVVALVAEQVDARPDAVAAVFDGAELTYGELDRRANRLANLLAARGVGLGARVGVALERSLDLVVSLLGVVKAGAAYVPLDPSHPAERLRFLLDDAVVAVLVADCEPEGMEGGPPAVLLGRERARLAAASPAPPRPRLSATDLAYVTYTSGSTGRPKGIGIPHRAVCRLVREANYLAVRPGDRMAQVSNASFDAATFEVWGALANGATLVGIPRETALVPGDLGAALAASRATVLFLTTALFNQMAREARPALAGLGALLFGGEAVDPAAVRRVVEEGGPERLLHVYGPTEGTTFSSWHEVGEVAAGAVTVAIGRALSNGRLYVADRHLEPRPAGVPGELWIAGDGLAQGYWRHPERTAESFVPDPWSDAPGGRLYRTGDVVRLGAGGNVEFLGRIDFQVKLRGFRIEPGEIESALLAHPGVAEALVAAPPDDAGERRLVAWVVGKGGRAPRPGAAELRAHLASRLPPYMVPAAFVELPAFPLTPHGKVDRRALPAPAAADRPEEAPAPRTPVEELLAGIWEEVLGVDRAGRDDDFFALGGHSLLVTRVLSRVEQALGVRLPVQALFENPTVGTLAQAVAAARREAAEPLPPLVPVPRGGRLPLSPAQQRLWFLDRLAPDSPAYNVAVAYRLGGTLEPAALAAALSEVAQRHEALRTRFVELDGQPAQEIEVPRPVPLPGIDLRRLDEGRRAAELSRLGRGEERQPFDLSRGPVLRARLVALASREHALLLTVHHAVADAGSLEILARELAALYAAASARRLSPLAPLPLQYADFAAWQRAWPEAVLARQLEHWRGKLAGLPRVLEVPADRPRPAVQSFRGGSRELRLPAALAAELRRLARRQEATLYMVLLAGFSALLARWSGQEELLIGAPVANRSRPEIEGVIGLFVNTLALPLAPHGETEFRRLLAAAREEVLAAFDHQDLPFEAVVDALETERDLGRSPLVQVMLAFHSRPALSESGGALEGALAMTPWRLGEHATAKFDLALLAEETADGGVALELNYAADLFTAATATRLLEHFATLLAAAVDDPGCPVARLALLSAAERQQLRHEWSDTATDYGEAPASLAELLERQVRRSPGEIAVVAEDETLTFAALDARANRLARHLARLGVGPETVVAIDAERSAVLMVGLLAILKAGGAYLPLDPEAPRERRRLMLADAGAAVLLTQGTPAEEIDEPGVVRVSLDDPEAPWRELPERGLPLRAADDHLAYVIYTSGSTGRPKGVMNTHRGIVNRLLWMQDRFRLTAADRVLQKTLLTFDVSVWELFWPLLTGARLVLARPGGHRDPAYLLEVIARQGITTLHFVPAMLRAFVDHVAEGGDAAAARLASLRRVMASGEALPADLARRGQALLGAPLHNLYGPTEAAVDVTHWACTAGDPGVPIGRPVANTAIHLLDRHAGLAPLGAPGELAIGGVQLARGYLGRPDLTAASFVPDPWGDGARLYRTGDVARHRPDGAVEYLGRRDHQVKIRGVRIELGEIEAALAAHPAVGEAVVVAADGPAGAADSAGRRLVAYVVPDPRLAAPLLRRERLEHEGRLAGVALHELPNGMAVAHQNRGETEFLYDEIFVREGYLRHGLEITPGDTVFDVGANIGLFSLFAGERAPGLRVYAFEPIPAVFAALALNAELYGLDARLFDCGLAAAPGAAEFTWYPRVTLISGRFADAAEEREVVRGFVERQHPAGDAASAAEVEELLDQALAGERVEVPLRTLSQVIAEEGVEQIDLLKIDVEKGELEVLDGLAEADWPKVRQLVVEVHDIEGRLAEITGRLRRHGFEVVVEQEAALAGSDLHNLYARRPGPPRSPEPAPVRQLWHSRAGLAAELRQSLAATLPEVMIPAAFVVLPALPLTASGKVDRRALPAPDVAPEAGDGEKVAPRNPLEERLAALWREVLGVERVGVHDSFFRLGGHSLLATRLLARLRAAFGVELPLGTLFQRPTLAELAAELAAQIPDAAAGPAADASPIRPVPRDGRLALSFPQLRQWFLAELEPGTTAYNVPLTLALDGELRLGPFAGSLAEIVRRHEVLRTTFREVDGEPSAVVADCLELPLPVIDLAALPASARAAECQRLVEAEGRRVFDLARGPLLHHTLVCMEPCRHLLLATVHHIVFDGWSVGVLSAELAALYAALSAGRPSPLPALAVQYADYAAWQRRWLAGEEGARQAAFWRGRLAGANPTLPLPTDRPRQAVQTYRGGSEPFALPARQVEALRALGLAHGATLYMTLLAGYAALLARHARQEDLNVGTFVANRRWQALEPLIGFFLNTLALRVDAGGAPSFAELVARVRETTLAAYEHQDLPFERVLEELGTERDRSRSPLFQALLVLQSFAAPARAAAGLPIEPVDLYRVERANFDLALMAAEEGGGLRAEMVYNRDLFEAATVRRLLGHLAGLLAAAVAAPHRRVGELPLLAAAEHHQVAVEWPAAGWPEAPVQELPRRLLRAQAARTPETPAVVAGERVLTYGELERRVGGLARHLQRLGLGPESLVGISVPRSLEMVIGVLAVLEAGAGYLPLDPDLPAERFAFLLTDSGATALLTLDGQLPAGAASFAGPVLALAGPPEPPAPAGDAAAMPLPDPLPGNLAYVIYTSGSTGRPKGVLIPHGALGQFTVAAAATYGIGRGDRVLQFASLSFDVSLEEIFPCLAMGATLVLRGDAMMESPAHFLAACGDFGITVLDLPTAYWHSVAAEVAQGGRLPASLRLVIMGGERPLPEPVAGWLAVVGAHPRLFNTYGPTEATVMSTACPLNGAGAAALGATAVPLGRAWGGSRLWLLDAALGPVPLGVAGEIHLAGGLLARGYLGRPELTAAAFVPCPLGGPGERLYRSGDLARYRPDDGWLEFLVRVDDQVKIRGFRVEPGEVAAVLARHPAVAEAAVVASETGAGLWQLTAYVVAGGERRPEREELRDFLKAQLPAYMVPADFVPLPALPRTATGKLDLAALPKGSAPAAGYAPPETAVEEALAGIWQELLGRERVGLHDNLFDIGGHSLLVPQIMSRVEAMFEIKLPLRVLFEGPTVAELAQALEDALFAQIEELSDEEAARWMEGGGPAAGQPEAS